MLLKVLEGKAGAGTGQGLKPDSGTPSPPAFDFSLELVQQSQKVTLG